MSDDEDDNPNKMVQKGKSDGKYLLRRGALAQPTSSRANGTKRGPPRDSPTASTGSLIKGQ
eukprot:1148316-Pelagomonas_calceolata.AAC.1